MIYLYYRIILYICITITLQRINETKVVDTIE